jgi:hypothetical protein
MMASAQATWLAFLYVLFAGLLGIGAGGASCLLMRRGWTVRTAIADGFLAAIVCFVVAYVWGKIASSKGVWDIPISLIFGIATASVPLRHLFVALRSSRTG